MRTARTCTCLITTDNLIFDCGAEDLVQEIAWHKNQFAHYSCLDRSSVHRRSSVSHRKSFEKSLNITARYYLVPTNQSIMDLRAVTGNIFPEPYDMYYANFRRVCAYWMKSLPKLAKCPSELECVLSYTIHWLNNSHLFIIYFVYANFMNLWCRDYFKILQRTITHPTIEPRFQLNSYLKYSFFLNSPIRRYNGLRTGSAGNFNNSLTF